MPFKFGIWKVDDENNTVYLEINGVKVAEIDANGNLKLKGEVWVLQSL